MSFFAWVDSFPRWTWPGMGLGVGIALLFFVLGATKRAPAPPLAEVARPAQPPAPAVTTPPPQAPADAAPHKPAPGRRARPPGERAPGVQQRSEGAGSPNIFGNNNQVTTVIAPGENPRGELGLLRRYEEAGAEGITQTAIFSNSGGRVTFVAAVRILDSGGAVVGDFKAPTGRIEPSLPETVPAGEFRRFKLKVSRQQAERAHWFEWEWEGGRKERQLWTNRDLYVALSGAAVGTGSVAGELTVEPKQREVWPWRQGSTLGGTHGVQDDDR